MSFDSDITFSIFNENFLHKKVISYLKNYYPKAKFISCLGTTDQRIEAIQRGYQKGTPDIIILNPNRDYNGFAIELKTPNGNGVLSENQKQYIVLKIKKN